MEAAFVHCLRDLFRGRNDQAFKGNFLDIRNALARGSVAPNGSIVYRKITTAVSVSLEGPMGVHEMGQEELGNRCGTFTRITML